MAGLGDIDSILEIYDSGDKITGIDIQTYQNAVTTSLNDVTISASASNFTIPVGNKGTIKELRIFTDYTKVPYISCKINGQSKSWVINPVQVFTEAISSLTVSNSDTVNGRVVNIEIISTTS